MGAHSESSRWPRALVVALVIAGTLVGRADAVSTAAGGSRSSEPGQRYVVLLGGFNSSSGADERGDLSAHFKVIEDAIVGRDPGRPGLAGLRRVIYFSYGAAARLADAAEADRPAGQGYCAGWEAGCSAVAPGSLVSLDRRARYERRDTHLPIDLQADALQWLLEQVRREDDRARIDLVGFSLGGIVVTRWAARYGGSPGPAAQVRSLVLLNSPVGGVVGATPEELVQKILADRVFGPRVADELREPTTEEAQRTSIISSLPTALAHYDVTAIEATTDYLVNGRAIAVERLGPTVLGRGTAGWPPERLTQHVADFGGAFIDGPVTLHPLDLLGLTQRLLANHGTALASEPARDLVLEALRSTKAAASAP